MTCKGPVILYMVSVKMPKKVDLLILAATACLEEICRWMKPFEAMNSDSLILMVLKSRVRC